MNYKQIQGNRRSVLNLEGLRPFRLRTAEDNLEAFGNPLYYAAMERKRIGKVDLPLELASVLEECPGYTFFNSIDELFEAAVPITGEEWFDVAFPVEGKGDYTEARVCRVKNGIAVNYTEPYMRRRDPDCMVIGDTLESDKTRYKERFGIDFSPVREETITWLKTQKLACYTFAVGKEMVGKDAIVVAPANVGFFALGLGLLQGIIDLNSVDRPIVPSCFLYVAPTFRHTHFDGKQVVVHNRSEELYEIFSYNLYPGPSAKKGIYGALLHYGEQEGWVTAHASAVQVVTPYDNKVTIMHEGASGGGKSEMLEHIHREEGGEILLGENILNGEKHYITLPRTCSLHPVSDDMALCHPSIQRGDGKLYITDAEDSWFIRVDHITNYGTDPDVEARSVHPKDSLLFLNIDAKPGGSALLWEHIEDEPGKPCPNPRFIFPRKSFPHVVNKPAAVNIRSFGVRTPPCTTEEPTYGIIGMVQMLPPGPGLALALSFSQGIRQSEYCGKGGHGFGGGRLLLALCHREEGQSGEPFVRTDYRNPGGPLHPLSQSAYRRLAGPVHAPMDHAGVPLPPRRRLVYSGADRTGSHSSLRVLTKAGGCRGSGNSGGASYASVAAGNRDGNLPKRRCHLKGFLLETV